MGFARPLAMDILAEGVDEGEESLCRHLVRRWRGVASAGSHVVDLEGVVSRGLANEDHKLCDLCWVDGVGGVRLLGRVAPHAKELDARSPLGLAAEAHLQHAALARPGHAGAGQRAAVVYLHLHPESKRVGEAAKGLKSASASLVDDYFSKKDYLAVAYIYFKTFGVVAFQQDEYDQVEKMEGDE